MLTNNDVDTERPTDKSTLARRGPAVLAAGLLCTTVISAGYLMRERDRVQEMTASRDQAHAAMVQTRSQMEELNAKVNALAAARAASEAAAAAAARETQVRRAQVMRVPARRTPVTDPRVTKLQDQVAEHQKELAGTKEELRAAREELQGKLDTTRDELNGSIARNHDELNSSLTRSHGELSSSIARNHDELIELQKRGERNYYEFELLKSKKFQRTGPLGLSLRSADAKRKRYDFKMMVDDSELEKKRVNLFEPVMIYLPDRMQPLELVVNQIDKNRVKGYLSEPKYRKSETVATSAQKAPQLATRP